MQERPPELVLGVVVDDVLGIVVDVDIEDMLVDAEPPLPAPPAPPVASSADFDEQPLEITAATRSAATPRKGRGEIIP